MIKLSNSCKRYRSKPGITVTAIQIKLKTEGIRYEKWGAIQLARTNDWLVENDGECYTVAADSFSRTYQPVADGRYVKISQVWAYQATESGRIDTLEGSSGYESGDYIVFNNPDDPADVYAVAKTRFESHYIPDDTNDQEP